MVEVDAGGGPPVVTGPLTPTLLTNDRPTWHGLRDIGAHDMRRWRRLEVVPGARTTDAVHVEAYFGTATSTRPAARL
jgi:hypothetical protein